MTLNWLVSVRLIHRAFTPRLLREAPHKVQHSCHNAYRKIDPSIVPQIYDLRELDAKDVQIPERSLSDDGQCAFDVALVETSTEKGNLSNGLGIINAAEALSDLCELIHGFGGTVSGFSMCLMFFFLPSSDDCCGIVSMYKRQSLL